jgi:hypothetical protein
MVMPNEEEQVRISNNWLHYSENKNKNKISIIMLKWYKSSLNNWKKLRSQES